MFEYGQAYVALSRAVDLAGLSLNDFAPGTIKAHDLVVKFYDRMRRNLPTVASSALVETGINELTAMFALNRSSVNNGCEGEDDSVKKDVDWYESKRPLLSASSAQQLHSQEKAPAYDEWMEYDMRAQRQPQAISNTEKTAVVQSAPINFTAASSFADAFSSANGKSVSYNKKSNDWICPNQACRNIVFASKSSCFFCGSTKPQSLEQPAFAVPSHFGGRSNLISPKENSLLNAPEGELHYPFLQLVCRKSKSAASKKIKSLPKKGWLQAN
jgi:hypothetical protein